MDICGWKPGPLPPETYFWGGVVTRAMADKGQDGAHFADFCGDHVKLVPSGEVIKAEDVAFYNNCVDLPPTSSSKGIVGQSVGVERQVNNVEELREEILKGIDWSLTAPLVSRFMSRETRRILQAQRTFWQNDDGSQLGKVLEHMRREY